MTTKVAEPSTTDNQALTRAVSGSALITSPEAFATKLAEWQQQFNVLTPFSTFSALAPGWGISGTVVTINPDTRRDGPGEVYDGLPFLKKGSEVAIAKKGLRKLAEGAGISTQTYDMPTGHRFCWKVKAVATYRGLDGTPITREATKEWDLRDGSPQLKGWSADQINEGRKHGLRNCEARAINAAIRECGCGISQKYTLEQLKKPFLAIRVSFQPDMSDPEVRRIVTGAAMQATSALYGGAAGLVGAGAPRPIPDDIDDTPATEPRLVGACAGEGGGGDEPPTEDAVRIVAVKPVQGTSKKTGKPYTKFEITDSRGEVHSTFDRGLYDAAVAAHDAKTWVEVAVETQNGFKNLVEIAPAGQSPRLPMEGDL